MTQAARVALWVPTTVPPAAPEAIQTTNAPAGAQAPIDTTFVAPTTPTIPYADAAEIQAGTLATESINPLGLRTELNRLLGLPPADMAAGPPIAVSTNTPDRLLKTDASGLVASSVLSGVVDGGTF